ncbi:MAG: hypothetical protein ACRDZ4_18570, partial [Egibacteraceae bacterium]
LEARRWGHFKPSFRPYWGQIRLSFPRVSLRALTHLYPGSTVPGMLLGLLDEIDEAGRDPVFSRRQADHERRALLSAWIGTPKWGKSLEFLRRHQHDLATDESRQTLAETDDDTARQHLAILDLTQATSIDDAYAVVTDPAAAEDAAFAAIEDGDLSRMTAVAVAAPTLQQRPTTWNLLLAIFLLTQGDEESALVCMRQITDQATPMLRRAHTIRLRELRRHHPDLPGLDHLIQIVTLEDAAG